MLSIAMGLRTVNIVLSIVICRDIIATSTIKYNKPIVIGTADLWRMSRTSHEVSPS